MRKIIGEASFPIFCLVWLFIGIYMLATPVKAQDTALTQQFQATSELSMSPVRISYMKSKVDAHLDADELDAIRQIVREEIAAKGKSVPDDTVCHMDGDMLHCKVDGSESCLTQGGTVVCQQLTK